MATVFMRSMLLSVVDPLLHLSRCAGAPRAFCTSLLGTLAGLRPGAEVRSLLSVRAQPFLQPALGFKTKGVIKKRCKDCYLVKRRGRWFVYCKTHPRHKQRQM